MADIFYVGTFLLKEKGILQFFLEKNTDFYHI